MHLLFQWWSHLLHIYFWTHRLRNTIKFNFVDISFFRFLSIIKWTGFIYKKVLLKCLKIQFVNIEKKIFRQIYSMIVSKSSSWHSNSHTWQLYICMLPLLWAVYFSSFFFFFSQLLLYILIWLYIEICYFLCVHLPMNVCFVLPEGMCVYLFLCCWTYISSLHHSYIFFGVGNSFWVKQKATCKILIITSVNWNDDDWVYHNDLDHFYGHYCDKRGARWIELPNCKLKTKQTFKLYANSILLFMFLYLFSFLLKTFFSF